MSSRRGYDQRQTAIGWGWGDRRGVFRWAPIGYTARFQQSVSGAITLSIRYPYGPHALYGLRKDPGETVNRIDDPACKATVTGLKARLDDGFAIYVDPLLDGTYEPVCGRGQYGLAGPAGKGEPVFIGDGH